MSFYIVNRVLLFTLVIIGTNAELFTAISDLSQALFTENELHTAIKHEVLKHSWAMEVYNTKIEQLNEELVRSNKELKRLGAKWNDSTAFWDISTLEKIFADPLKAFIVCRSFVDKRRPIYEQLISDGKSGVMSQPDNWRKLLAKLETSIRDMPSEVDVHGIIDAIVRLQDTYQLTTAKIASGNLSYSSQSGYLSASDCLFVGQYAYRNSDFYHASLWLEEALRRLDEETPGPNIERFHLLDYLAFTHFKQGHYRTALAYTNELLSMDPSNERLMNNMEKYAAMITAEEAPGRRRRGDVGDSEEETVQHVTGYRTSDQFRKYEALCRGEKPMTKQFVSKQLYCRYYRPHPYYILGAIREEVANLQPRIVIWHQVIHDNEIQQIQELSRPRLRRATVRHTQTGQLVHAHYRISKSAWLNNDLDDVIRRINKRIEALTGLNVKTAEDLQVVNYGVGGHYEPHFDFARKSDAQDAFDAAIGNRVATLIFYMSDVVAGGATAFTIAGTQVWPLRGAAAFWWNLLPSGQGDLTTRHAACPVIAGSKWVMNKWFHERGQEFIRMCATESAGGSIASSVQLTNQYPDSWPLE